MAEQKTKPTNANVDGFLAGIADEQKRQDCYSLLGLMQEVIGQPAQLWGESIVGFGSYHYRYASGHEGDAPLVGFSPRKQQISLYLMPGLQDPAELLHKLGKHKAGKGCLYIKKLSDVDQQVLRELIQASVEMLRQHYPQQEAAR